MSTLSDLVGAATTGAVSPITGIVQAAQGILGLFKMDPTKKAEIQAQLVEENIDLEKAQLAADLASAQGQLAINLQEAKNNRIFDDWRDAVGWTCALALFWNSLGLSFLSAILVIVHPSFNIALLPPRMDMTQLIGLLATMLGTGASQFHLSQ